MSGETEELKLARELIEAYKTIIELQKVIIASKKVDPYPNYVPPPWTSPQPVTCKGN